MINFSNKNLILKLCSGKKSIALYHLVSSLSSFPGLICARTFGHVAVFDWSEKAVA
jgi:hypothetical protein